LKSGALLQSKSYVRLKIKKRLRHLLEIAKIGVERAIETDEAAATAWMNQQLEALGVEIPNLTESIRRHNV
jgi:type I restriction enzyme M protein